MTVPPRLTISLCIVVALVLAGGTGGCTMAAKNLNASKMGPPYEIAVFEKGKPVSKRKLQAMSEQEQAIAHWIEANRHGWRPTFGNQAPSRVVKGDGFRLNFTDTDCVVTIPPDPTLAEKKNLKPMQLYKKLNPGDMELAEALNSIQ